MSLPSQLQFFDPAAEYTVAEGRLPHWEQAGTVAFITFRTWDSMPREVVERWLAARNEWLNSRGIDPTRPGWQDALARLSADEQGSFRRLLSARWEESLDQCHGSCPLQIPACSEIVARSIRHFDGSRYVVFDFVVMPNHVHVLASFSSAAGLCQQCKSWKHYTAVELNTLLGRRGRFWEEESFDHLVRSEEQFLYFRDYIASNPVRAKLAVGNYVHYSRPLTRAARGASGLHSGAKP